MVKLTEQQLNQRLTEIDADLSGRGFPKKYRALEAFKTLYGTVSDEAVRTPLLESVFLWFIAKLGDAAKWDAVIGRGPTIIRGNLYLIAFPFTSGDAALNLWDQIENLPKHIRETLTEDEFREVGNMAIGAMTHFGYLYDLTVQDTFLTDTEKALVWRGLADFELAAQSIKQNEDTQNAIFHTHQAAEKFLKAALLRSGFKGDLKKLSHDLPKIFKELIAIKSRYTWLKISIDALQQFAPNMEIRYGVVPRTMENAVSSFYSALNVCAVLAQVWLYDLARGTDKATFTPGKFYTDGSANTFRCEALLMTNEKRPGAILRLFGNRMSPVVMMDIVRDMDQSSLHLEVSDPQKVAQLEEVYRFDLQRRGKKVKPEELGIKITSGPEGSGVTGYIQAGINIKE
jgi:HEPN domain-containing protein